MKRHYNSIVYRVSSIESRKEKKRKEKRKKQGVGAYLIHSDSSGQLIAYRNKKRVRINRTLFLLR